MSAAPAPATRAPADTATGRAGGGPREECEERGRLAAPVAALAAEVLAAHLVTNLVTPYGVHRD